MAKRTDPLMNLRLSIRDFRNKREEIKSMQEDNKTAQPELIAAMQDAGVDENGIIIDDEDDKGGTAYVIAPEGSLVWDEDKILDWLNKPVAGRRSLLRKCQSTVFDLNKFEALVASKEISPKVAKRFQRTTDPSSPYIRFGKKKRESL